MNHLLELHRAVRDWAEQSLASPVSSVQSDRNATLAYIDLFFAFGLAKRGAATEALELVTSASRIFEPFPSDEDRGLAASFLLRAFRYRIHEALAGRPHAGSLAADLLAEVDHLANSRPNSASFMAHYAINRMRERNRILEPEDRIDPYVGLMRDGDDLIKSLSQLRHLRDSNDLARRVDELYGTNSAVEARLLVLSEALPWSLRVGEPFALELLARVPEALTASQTSRADRSIIALRQGALLERAIWVAEHFKNREAVRRLVAVFLELVNGETEEGRFLLVSRVLPTCLECVRRLELRELLDEHMASLHTQLFGNHTLSDIRRRSPKEREAWGRMLQAAVLLAGGWLSVGRTELAEPAMQAARQELLGPAATPLHSREYTLLAQAYISALGLQPGETGTVQITNLFRAMDPARVTNSFTTSKFFSRFHLSLAEETVWAVSGPDSESRAT